MEALDRIFDYKLSSNVKDHLIDTLEEYKNYLKTLKFLPEKDRKIFLDIIKKDELVNTQEMENEDPFVALYELDKILSKRRSKSSIDYLKEVVLSGEKYNDEILEKAHKMVIAGSFDDRKENYHFRENDTYVYEINNSINEISYYAPSPEEIRPYLQKLYAFMDSYKENEALDVIYKPIMEQFFIAALQPFGNGNTRLARLVEYIDLFKYSRESIDNEMTEPTLYLSKNYLINRNQYRENIKKLVQNPTDLQLECWLNYNLNRYDDQLYYNNNNLMKILK